MTDSPRIMQLRAAQTIRSGRAHKPPHAPATFQNGFLEFSVEIALPGKSYAILGRLTSTALSESRGPDETGARSIDEIYRYAL